MEKPGEGWGELGGEEGEGGRGMGRRRLSSLVGVTRRGGDVGLTPPSGSSCDFTLYHIFGGEKEPKALIMGESDIWLLSAASDKA